MTTTRAGVLLHGRGRTADEMIDLAGRLNIGGVRWLAPAAEGGSWYPQRFMEPLALNEPALTQAIARVDHSVTEAGDEGRIASDGILLIGFSQGACLATEYVLRHPGRCGRVVVFTGGAIGPPGTVWTPRDGLSLAGLRMLITGSDIDEWVPEARVRETAEVFTRLGADVQLRIYPGRAHEVSEAEIADARAWIDSRHL